MPPWLQRERRSTRLGKLTMVTVSSFFLRSPQRWSMSATNLPMPGNSRMPWPRCRNVVDLYRELARDNASTYLPSVAEALATVGIRLAQTHRAQAAVTATQEAVAAYRQVIQEGSGAHLPALAASLADLSLQLAVADEPDAAVAAMQEAVATYRQVTADDATTCLPDLARALANLGDQLTGTGQQDAALAPAQEAVTIYQQLTRDNLDHLPELAGALNILGDSLTAAGRAPDIDRTWEAAIAELPEGTPRLALTALYASRLLGQQVSDKGLRLLVTVLTAPEVPGPVEAAARQILRRHWRDNAEDVEDAWRSASVAPVPSWTRLTDEHIHTVTQWVEAETWAESRNYFQDHADELLAEVTFIALEEISLTSPGEWIAQRRDMLRAIREHGPDIVYQEIMLIDTLREWISAPDWDTSQAFLEIHPELIAPKVCAILTMQRETSNLPYVLEALLLMSAGPLGVEGAYRCLRDDEELTAVLSAAITAHDASTLRACSAIETFVNDRPLTGAIYLTLAILLTEDDAELSEELADSLRATIAQASPAERAIAREQFNNALGEIPAGSAMAQQVQQILAVADTL